MDQVQNIAMTNIIIASTSQLLCRCIFNSVLIFWKQFSFFFFFFVLKANNRSEFTTLSRIQRSFLKHRIFQPKNQLKLLNDSTNIVIDKLDIYHTLTMRMAKPVPSNDLLLHYGTMNETRSPFANKKIHTKTNVTKL